MRARRAHSLPVLELGQPASTEVKESRQLGADSGPQLGRKRIGSVQVYHALSLDCPARGRWLRLAAMSTTRQG